MSEQRPIQFIKTTFPLIDSELMKSWDARGYKLYLKMRRHICRSSKHRLSGYWLQGYLAVDGYLGSWASWMGVSKQVISKLLKWMEEKNIIVCAQKSKTAGQPNIYILGQVLHIEGSENAL